MRLPYAYCSSKLARKCKTTAGTNVVYMSNSHALQILYNRSRWFPPFREIRLIKYFLYLDPKVARCCTCKQIMGYIAVEYMYMFIHRSRDVIVMETQLALLQESAL